MPSDEAMGIWRDARRAWHNTDSQRLVDSGFKVGHNEAAATVIDKALAQQREEIAAWLLNDATRLAYEETPEVEREHPFWWAADVIRSGEYRKEK